LRLITPWHILGLAALGGSAMAFDMPARQSFMVEMTSREDLINAVSLNSSIVNGARVVGPSVAGFVMATTSVAVCFFLNGLSFVAVIAALLLMRLPKFIPPDEPASTWDHAVEGFKYVATHQRVRRLLTLFGVVGVFGWSYSVLMPALAKEVLGVGGTGYSALLTANGLGALAGALSVATFGGRATPRLLIFGGLGVFSSMLVLLGLTRIYQFDMACLAVAGWGMMLYFATTNTLIQTSVPDEMRGRVMGIWALLFGGMLPLGALEAGVLSNWLGVRWAVVCGGLVCAAAASAMWLALKRNPSTS
jgi:predicted MFS family arabinose efflux permease